MVERGLNNPSALDATTDSAAKVSSRNDRVNSSHISSRNAIQKTRCEPCARFVMHGCSSIPGWELTSRMEPPPDSSNRLVRMRSPLSEFRCDQTTHAEPSEPTATSGDMDEMSLIAIGLLTSNRPSSTILGLKTFTEYRRKGWRDDEIDQDKKSRSCLDLGRAAGTKSIIAQESVARIIQYLARNCQ